MNFTKKPISAIRRTVTSPFRSLKWMVKERLDWIDQPRIVPYRGFGNREHCWIRGSIRERKSLSVPKHEHPFWQNALDMIKRYTGDAIPGVRIRLSTTEHSEVIKADEKGQFECLFDTPSSAGDDYWQPISFELIDPIEGHREEEIRAEGEVFIPSQEAEYGIISDIDDTVLVSYSTETLKKLRLMLLHNASTRIPFEGIAELYQALKRGTKSEGINPLFYVSSSEWNLYDLLRDFCSIHGLPKAPYLLRDLPHSPWKIWKSGGGTHDHKFRKIRQIMSFYPDLPFILIGDSGQHDAEIYSAIARDHPERILSIYIRDVTSEKRDREVQKIRQELREVGVPLLPVQRSGEVLEHARRNGFIA